MMSTIKSGFWLSSSVHMRPPSPCEHTYVVDMKYTSLSWNSFDLPGLKLKVDCNNHCNLFKNVQLVIYITNSYWRKISTFYSVQRWYSSPKEANFFAWGEDWMTSVGFNFPCGCPTWSRPPSSACIHLNLTPLCVDVINGWPLTTWWREQESWRWFLGFKQILERRLANCCLIKHGFLVNTLSVSLSVELTLGL